MNVQFKVFEAPEVSPFAFRDSKQVYEGTKAYGKADREIFLILHMNSKNGLIKEEVHSIGTVNQSAVYPREIARSAILNNSSSVILIHNHPSGDPAPSEPDKEQTRRIINALNLFDIKVLDHIILGRDKYYSFRDQRLISLCEELIKNKP